MKIERKDESRYRMANCVTSEGVAQCFEDWEQKGIRPMFVVFSGMVVKRGPGLVGANEPQQFPSYLVIGEANDA